MNKRSTHCDFRPFAVKLRHPPKPFDAPSVSWHRVSYEPFSDRTTMACPVVGRTVGTSVAVPSWDPLTQPECENCHGLSRPVRKKECTCKPIQLTLSPKLRLRRRAYQLLKDAEIPRDTFATRILGTSPSTLWRQLKADRVPTVTRQQLQSIEYVRREGTKVMVVYDIGNLGARWTATLTRRAKRAKLASCAPQ